MARTFVLVLAYTVWLRLNAAHARGAENEAGMHFSSRNRGIKFRPRRPHFEEDSRENYLAKIRA